MGKGDKSRPDSSTMSSTAAGLAAAAAAVAASTATTPATPDRFQRTRSRHSSGASNISVKGRINEESSRKNSETGLTGGRSRSEAEEEEPWHINLRQRFMKEYQQYLVSELGFIKLNVQPSMTRAPTAHHGRGQGSNQNVSDTLDSKVVTINLQKTLTGGIIVMELSFRQEFFCVRMFAIDCSQFKVIVNQQMHLIFVDECDKYKDLIHVHSFAHDFHLRCVQRYLNKQEDSIFPIGFDLDSFLSDFKQVYPYPPSFSRNCLQQDSMTLSELPFPGNMLYEYMLRQMGVQDMCVFRMGDKFALVKHDKLQLPSTSKGEDEDGKSESLEVYDAGLVIINNWSRVTDDPMKLVLKHFTVLTRQRDCYPIRTLDKAFGDFRGSMSSVVARRKSAISETFEPSEGEEKEDTESSKPVPVKQHIGMRKEHVNYRGYSNLQQFSLYSTLIQQSKRGGEKILEMIEMSKKKCRRDYLWQRLLTYQSDVEEGRKRRSDTEDSVESVLSPLSSYEFCELLQTVTMTPLSEADPNLSPLFNMPISWYQDLFTALTNKYPDAHRIFSSPDRKTQYIVVLNSNNLNMFTMLSLNDATEQIELCVVMKEPVMDDYEHSPENPNLPLYSLQTHMEDFVNVCCYHVWASMVQ